MNARRIVDRLLEDEVQSELPLSGKPEAETVPAPSREPQNHASYHDNKRAMPILPIGVVNLVTGRNNLFGNVFDGWEEDPSSTNLLVKDTSGKVMAVHSSGRPGLDVGAWMAFKHDQTWRRIGNIWQLIGEFPHTKQGLAELAKKAGRNSISMATFK